MRQKLEGKLVVATHNPGKCAELRKLLVPYGIEALSAAELGLWEPEETGASFCENAIIKARGAAEGANLPALADDSGLCVDALAGAPGIYSARWAGEARDFASAMKRVEREVLAANPEAPPKAHFACVLALAFPDGEVETFEGKVFGALQFPPRGSLGFGYDPIFLAQGLFADIWRDDRRRKARRSGRWLGGPFAPGARIPSLCAAPRRLSEI